MKSLFVRNTCGIRAVSSRLLGKSLRNGGAGRNRTGVHGVAVRCMTTLPPRLSHFVIHIYLCTPVLPAISISP